MTKLKFFYKPRAILVAQLLTVTALKAYYVFAVDTHTTNIKYINVF